MKWKNPLRQNAPSGRKVSAKAHARLLWQATHALNSQSLPSLLAKILRELKPGQPDMLARHGIGNICRISIQAHIGIKAAILHIHHQQGRAVAKRLLIHAHNAKAIAVDRRVNQIQFAIIEDKIRGSQGEHDAAIEEYEARAKEIEDLAEVLSKFSAGKHHGPFTTSPFGPSLT